VLLDEVHHAPAVTFTEVLGSFPAAFRYGLTATPDRADGLGPFMELAAGPIRHAITAGELRTAGVLVTPQIEWVRTDFHYPYNDDWVSMISALVEDGQRNSLLIGVISSLIDDGRQIIALGERVKHVQYLAAAVNAIRPGAAEVITGSMSAKKRGAALERVKKGEARVMFSTKLADEGLDCPNLDTLILLLTPSRNAGRTTQRAGRILRSVDGKRQPVVYDVVDSSVGLLWSQARSRFFGVYRELSPGCRLPLWLDKPRKRAA